MSDLSGQSVGVCPSPLQRSQEIAESPIERIAGFMLVPASVVAAWGCYLEHVVKY